MKNKRLKVDSKAPTTFLFLKLLKKACELFGYSWHLIDKHSNNLVEVSNGNKAFFASNVKTGAYPLNLAFASQVAADKAWCYEILKQKKYKIPKGNYFFLKSLYRELRGDRKELSDAIVFASNKYPVFVKPNSSSSGILAEVIYDEKQLVRHLKQISELDSIALIQEVIKLPEYRIFVVDGEIQFAYQRVGAKIIGDGKRTIDELIFEINKNIEKESNKIKGKNSFLEHLLKKEKLNLNSRMKAGKFLQVVSKTNIGAGGTIQNYTETISKDTQQWVKKLMADIPLRVCGIDIFAAKTLNEPEGFTVIELNSSPDLSGIYKLGKEEKVMKIWGKILKKYFED